MRRDDVRFAVAAREDGLRRVKSLTTRIGAVGVVSSAAIAVALGHPAGAAVHATGNGTASQNRTGRSGNSPSTAPGNSAPGSAQPRTPPSSSSPPSTPPSSSSQQASSQPSSPPQAPVQNPAPVAAPSQAVSGGS
jgi:hypothetical protein